MIYSISGDMFSMDHEAIVNPINCVGTMGNGVAKLVKERFPSIMEPYKKYCNQKLLHPGSTWVYKTGVNYPKYILNTATKNHWKEPSKINNIIYCYTSIIRAIKSKNISNIAIPPLGCGNGKLNWHCIRPLAIDILESNNLDHVNIYLYEPYMLSDEF